jgi:hypothetical protein
MPHVRVYGTCSVRAHWERFARAEWRDETRILKTLASFLASDGSSELVECLAIEGFLRQSFLAQLLQKEDGVLVRIYPPSTPEKTEGVRLCLGWIAASLREQDPECRLDGANLGAAIPEDRRR